MRDVKQWREFWQEKGRLIVSDYELDRGTSPRTAEIEDLSNQEQREFIDPSARDMIFDAGCGTGTNELLLHSRIQRIVGMDYSESAVARCRQRLDTYKVANAELLRGDVVAVPLADNSVDKVLCMSVLQFLSDEEVHRAFAEFARILKPEGTMILHVKNLSSLYLSTLWAMKRLLLLAGKHVTLEYFRPYRWYVRELRAAGFHVLHYNSFNLFMIEGMPRHLLGFLQKLELRHRKKFPFRTGFMRRHGSELKIKASISKTAANRRIEPGFSPNSSIRS